MSTKDKQDIIQTWIDIDVETQELTQEQRYAAYALRESIFKKNTDYRQREAGNLAKELFLAMNKRCKNFRPDRQDAITGAVVAEMRKTLASWVLAPSSPSANTSCSFALSKVFEFGEFGPGSSRGTRHTSFIGKISSSKLTATSKEIIAQWEAYCRTSVRNTLAEHERISRFGPPVVIPGSKYSTVPKTRTIDRSIATEPSLNMFFQRGLAQCLDRVLMIKTGLNSAVQQTKAKALAKRGSIDGSFGTIDLSSASDTVSLRLVHMLFPPDFCTLIDMYRSKYVEIDGRNEKLYMVATMGCGYTFSLQTMIFTALVLACYEVQGIKPIYPRGKRLGNFSVFGDDIIVREDAYDLIVRSLESLGFILNETKSFNTGLFRESCGGDYYNGLNVRGVYNKSLDAPHSIYATINLLVLWSARTNILLPETIGQLLRWVDHRENPIEGFAASDGLFHYDAIPTKVVCGTRVYTVKRVRSRRIPLSVFQTAPNCVLQAALKGAISGDHVTTRQEMSRGYDTINVIVPNYRYISDDTLEMFFEGDRNHLARWIRLCDFYFRA